MIKFKYQLKKIKNFEVILKYCFNYYAKFCIDRI